MKKQKSKEIILYILKKCGPLDEKKLQYLLYFIDFDFYEKYEKKLMGFNYKKL